MKSEYVGLNHVEKKYGEKELLNVQLEILDSLKRFKSFKKLREEEHVLRIALKSGIGQAKEALKVLGGFLPKTDYKLESEGSEEELSGEEVSLAREIEEIRRKLWALREG